MTTPTTTYVRNYLLSLGAINIKEPLIIQPKPPQSWNPPQDTDIPLTPSILPSGDSVTFTESSFFKANPNMTSLPSPDFVYANSTLSTTWFRASLAKFPELRLVVKYGASRVCTIAEGQCLWAIRRVLGGAVPVPEVYGWCKQGKDTFIYMELVEGDTLEDRWKGLEEEDRLAVCRQLRGMLDALRRLKQEPGNPLVSHIGGQPLCDIAFSSIQTPIGPFPTVSAFNDAFSYLAFFTFENAKPGTLHPLRPLLPDDAPVKFTHNDLHPSNILISKADGHPPRVVAIIDWHQSGWLPEYCEYFKTLSTGNHKCEWEKAYVPLFLQEYHGYGYWEIFYQAGYLR